MKMVSTQSMKRQKVVFGVLVLLITVICIAVAIIIGFLLGLGYISSSIKVCTDYSCLRDHATTGLWFWRCMGCGVITLIVVFICVIALWIYIGVWYDAYRDITKELLYKKHDHDNNIEMTSLYARVKDVVLHTFIYVDDADTDTSRDWIGYETYHPHYKYLLRCVLVYHCTCDTFYITVSIRDIHRVRFNRKFFAFYTRWCHTIVWCRSTYPKLSLI